MVQKSKCVIPEFSLPVQFNYFTLKLLRWFFVKEFLLGLSALLNDFFKKNYYFNFILCSNGIFPM